LPTGENTQIEFSFVTGHDFSRAEDTERKCWALQAAEKGGTISESPEKPSSGAKARVDSVGFMRGLKPPPPSGLSFSAACLAPAVFIFSYLHFRSG
jgi:hypothetical protein